MQLRECHRLLLACFAGLLWAAASARADWSFSDQSVAAGASWLHQQTVTIDDEELAVSAGVGAGDFNNDGHIDLYVVTGDALDNVLLQNNGNGTFSNVTAGSSLALSGHMSAGPAFADIDGDGWEDLVVGGVKGHGYQVFRNDQDGTFTNITLASGITQQHEQQNDYSSAFGDPDLDGDLDLFIAHHSFRDTIKKNHYWRNTGTGVFIASDAWAGITAWNTGADTTFAPVFTDIDGDGWQDLLVAADVGKSEYFLNDQTGRMVLSTTAVINDQYGMGSATGDFDNDGDIDWFVTSIYDDPLQTPRGRTGNRLYKNDGLGTFTEVSNAAGVRNGHWGWGACAADFNNDGWLDLFHVNGFFAILNEGSYYEDDPALMFINNQDGTYTESAVALNVNDGGQGRGVVCFDYDSDGDIDIFVAKNSGLSKLYRNDLGDNPGYLQVELQAYETSKTVAGAIIEIDIGNTSQMREVTIGSNFESQNPLLQHFGLGGAASVDEVRIRWPNGDNASLQNVSANQKILIVQDTPITQLIFGSGFEP